MHDLYTTYQKECILIKKKKKLKYIKINKRATYIYIVF